MESSKTDSLSLQNALLRWFQNHGRSLPWRRNYEPYHVWLSEVMLQQTQMERGVRYFNRWLVRFPTIESVAAASGDEVLKYWEGLGYYARARNLHKAARYIVQHFNCLLPQSFAELVQLPGVGPYTAAAIASIAFNRDLVVVDANVKRVFSRVFDVAAPLASKGAHDRITTIAKELLPSGQARDFNQALMELGGVVCTPKNPKCGVCPVVSWCKAYQGNFVEERPVKKRAEQLISIEMATSTLVVDGYVFIQQRHYDDIWGGLWEFPGGRLKEGEHPEETVVREYLEETGFRIEICCKVTEVIHHHTKYKITLYCYQSRLMQSSKLPALAAARKFHWVQEKQLDAYGFPAGHRKFIEYIRSNCPKILIHSC